MDMNMSSRKKSTIEHQTTYLPDRDTNNFLRVGNISKHIDHQADRTRKRSPLDKIKKYAIEKFGYQEIYLNNSR